MTVEISNMLLVVCIAVLSASVNAGYNYHVPSASLELPNFQAGNTGYRGHQVQHNNLHTHDSSVSYSVSKEDYQYLKRYKNGQQDSLYNTDQHSTPLTNHHDKYYHGDHYSNQNIGFSNNNGNKGHAISIQTGIQPNTGVNYNAYNTAHGNVPIVEPIVTKHIYFHVPPPDVEESSVQTLPSPPPKKVYNIVFIKVPSQVSRNVASLQSLSAGQQAPVEDKTLIYVLVKKPDPAQQSPAPEPLVSQHEVFYVKYKGDAGNVATQVNNQLTQINNPQTNTDPLLQLQPGLVNGQQF